MIFPLVDAVFRLMSLMVWAGCTAALPFTTANAEANMKVWQIQATSHMGYLGGIKALPGPVQPRAYRASLLFGCLMVLIALGA